MHPETAKCKLLLLTTKTTALSIGVNVTGVRTPQIWPAGVHESVGPLQ